MLPIEIVGFLPQAMGDLIVVPAAITKQMGADFDVDKLYIARYNYESSTKGSGRTALLFSVDMFSIHSLVEFRLDLPFHSNANSLNQQT